MRTHKKTSASLVLIAVLQIGWLSPAAGLDVDEVYERAADYLNENPQSFASKLAADAISDRFKFLDISYVDPNDEDSNGGWNAKYNLKYESERGTNFSIDTGRAKMESFSLGLDIEGSYSFDSAANTDDLSKINLALTYVRGDWGELDITDAENSQGFQICMDELDKPPDQADYETNAEFDEAAREFGSAAEICVARHGINQLGQSSSRPYAYAIDFHGALEGDQNYSNSQTTYGLQGLFSARDLPSLRLVLERVDASENEVRLAITDDDEFDRLSAEIGYRYQLTRINDYPVTLYLNYRYFYELSAPDEVEQADIDRLDYFAVALRVPAAALGFIKTEDFSLFLRYSDGQLPFDRESESAISLGFSTNIGFLGKLLGD